MLYSSNSKALFRYSLACAELLRLQDSIRESLPPCEYSQSCWALANWVEHKFGFRKVLVAAKAPDRTGFYAHWVNVTPQKNLIDFKQTLAIRVSTGEYEVVYRLSLDSSGTNLLPTNQSIQNYKFDPIVYKVYPIICKAYPMSCLICKIFKSFYWRLSALS